MCSACGMTEGTSSSQLSSSAPQTWRAAADICTEGTERFGLARRHSCTRFQQFSHLPLSAAGRVERWRSRQSRIEEKSLVGTSDRPSSRLRSHQPFGTLRRLPMYRCWFESRALSLLENEHSHRIEARRHHWFGSAKGG